MRAAAIVLLALAGCGGESGTATPIGGDTVAAGAASSADVAHGAPGDVAGAPGDVGDVGGEADPDAVAAADAAPRVPEEPTVTGLAQVVPSDLLPPEVAPQDANNNLDITWHDGRLYLAFRTAPNHFASAEAELHVVSTDDEEAFRYEGTFAMGTDLREPRLLSYGGALWLYFAVLGASAFDFQPKGSMVTRYEAPGAWSEPEWFREDGFIPWRLRVDGGVPTMIGYIGGEGIYDEGEPAIEVHWLKSSDGETWEPVVPGQPVVLEGGVSETDLAVLDDGSIVAVGRNEAGDEGGFGSKICRAAAGSLGDWTCAHDPRKYDSPLVFRHGPEVYLIGRRNVTETGAYDLGRDDLPPDERGRSYQLAYWNEPKRCALWRVDPEALAVEWVLDLPSKGDTCFPGLVPLSATEYLVYNYTSPLDGDDVPWVEGQLGPTHIVRQVLTLPPATAR